MVIDEVSPRLIRVSSSLSNMGINVPETWQYPEHLWVMLNRIRKCKTEDDYRKLLSQFIRVMHSKENEPGYYIVGIFFVVTSNLFSSSLNLLVNNSINIGIF